MRGLLVTPTLLLAWMVLGPLAVAQAADEAVPITFSRLVLDVEGKDEISVVSGEYRIWILQELRRLGFHAVGAESLVFDKDESRRATLLLGGTVTQVGCRWIRQKERACRVAIAWQVLDTRHDRVAYQVMTWGLVEHAHELTDAKLGRQLVTNALTSLVGRARFRALASERVEASGGVIPDALHTVVNYRTCPAVDRPFPLSAPQVLPATVVVSVGNVVGSGFFISEDGLALTAAHVVHEVGDRVALRSQDGTQYDAVVQRIDKPSDVALLRALNLPAGTQVPCIGLQMAVPQAGAEVYAVGAPAGKELAFSLTKGIVSGVRSMAGRRFIQTDASVNPGNSGGPLLDSNAFAMGVVSWKIAGSGFEGIGFAVPAEFALQRLGLQGGAEASSALLLAAPSATASAPAVSVLDVDDRRPSLDAEGDARERQAEALAAITPAYIPAMRIGGAVLAVGGVAAIVGSSVIYDEDTTPRDNYKTLRAINDVGWVSAAVGATAFVLSFVMAPGLPETRAPESVGLRIDVAPTGALHLSGKF